MLDLGDSMSGGATLRTLPTTPAQVTSDQNNFNPGGSSLFQRLSSNASRTVTGLTFTVPQIDGQVHLIHNVGANTLVLAHESASSTAANRFTSSTSSDISLMAGEAALAQYDATTARWRLSKIESGPALQPAVSVTGSSTIAGSTRRLDVNGSAANTQTLPALSAVQEGWTVTVTDIGNTAPTNNITVQRAGSDTFLGGGTSAVIACNGCSAGVRKASGVWVLW